MIITKFVEMLLHLDKYLSNVVSLFGNWTYLILFLIVFCETGLVAAPFLPGDSLLFTAGALASITSLNPFLLFITLAIAAILGDTVNYWLGLYLGPKVFKKEDSFFLNKKHLKRAQEFYEKYGGKTIFLARFIPIIRTFAPFVAGIGQMHYLRFIAYNIAGAMTWTALFIFGGYFFGNLPIIKDNFSFFILGIIVVSFMPIFIEVVRNKLKKG